MTKLPILMYHCINQRDPRSPLGFLAFTPRQFRAHLRYFRDAGYETLTLPELLARSEAGSVAERRAVVLTFDDGFLDNAWQAADLLREFGMKGTIFVNPEFATDGPVRSRPTGFDSWGYLRYPEMEALQHDGVMDIQSHTMSHNRVFVSDTIIDFYRPERLRKYFWLAWLMAPPCKPDWFQVLEEMDDAIPTGLPIFEHDRALAGPRFLPDQAFLDHAVEVYQRVGEEKALAALAGETRRGRMETPAEYERRVRYEIQESKDILEKRLTKPVEHLCFPGGAYTPEALRIARAAGYATYMASSKDQSGDNRAALAAGPRHDAPIKLKRLSITHDLPGPMRYFVSDYNLCKFKVECYEERPLAKAILDFGRRVRGWLRPGRRRASAADALDRKPPVAKD